MTRAEVKDIVVEVLSGVVQAIGEPAPPIVGDMRPIGALPKFDSVLAEDTTVELFTRLGFDAELDVNPFIKGSHAASVDEVVDLLYKLVPDGARG